MKSPCQNQLDSSSRFNTTSACDGQTDGRTHDDNIYRASTASRGKKISDQQEWSGSVRQYSQPTRFPSKILEAVEDMVGK